MEELKYKIHNLCSKEEKEQEKADLSHETLMAETSLLKDSDSKRSRTVNHKKQPSKKLHTLLKRTNPLNTLDEATIAS